MGRNWNAIDEICEVPTSVHFATDDTVAQLPIFIVGRAVTKTHLCILFNGELDNDSCDTVLTAEDIERSNIWKVFVLYCQVYEWL
jgi:hypothetical protein